jgi:hypothetical protein
MAAAFPKETTAMGLQMSNQINPLPTVFRLSR